MQREMRTTKREDKAKSKTLVEEGGRHVRAELVAFRPWQMMLLHPSTKFFGMEAPQLNGDEPILLIMKRHDL